MHQIIMHSTAALLDICIVGKTYDIGTEHRAYRVDYDVTRLESNYCADRHRFPLVFC